MYFPNPGLQMITKLPISFEYCLIKEYETSRLYLKSFVHKIMFTHDWQHISIFFPNIGPFCHGLGVRQRNSSFKTAQGYPFPSQFPLFSLIQISSFCPSHRKCQDQKCQSIIHYQRLFNHEITFSQNYF